MIERFHARKLIAALSVMTSVLLLSPVANADHGRSFGKFDRFFDRGETSIDVEADNTALANASTDVDVDVENDDGFSKRCRRNFWKCWFSRPNRTDISIDTSNFTFADSSTDIDIDSDDGDTEVSLRSDSTAMASSSADIEVESR